MYEKTSTSINYERNWTVNYILHFSYVELYFCNCLHTEEILASYWHSPMSIHTKHIYLVFSCLETFNLQYDRDILICAVNFLPCSWLSEKLSLLYYNIYYIYVQYILYIYVIYISITIDSSRDLRLQLIHLYECTFFFFFLGFRCFIYEVFGCFFLFIFKKRVRRDTNGLPSHL